MAEQTDWLNKLAERLPGFLQSLEVTGETGRFLPCKRGATRLGMRAALGFSCFSLKLYKITGEWEKVNKTKQDNWIQFLKSFQVHGKTLRDPVTDNAFIDPVIVKEAYSYLNNPLQLMVHAYADLRNPRQMFRRMIRVEELTPRQKVIIAETKQAIATLVEVGSPSEIPYKGFPNQPPEFKNRLKKMDWQRPWGAGGQAAALAVFISLEAPKFLKESTLLELKIILSQLFEMLADPITGTYFKGRQPKYGELINGAMKVITALDWLEIPIQYPEALIDTCLAYRPISEGCHMVDVVYVLYRCSNQTSYRKLEIQDYCKQLLELIKHHYNPDGGFSYYINRSQTNYYGVQISKGLYESDIHGTLLLSWAVVMIMTICDQDFFNWNVIRP